MRIFKGLWEKKPQNNYAVRGVVRSYQALGKLPEARAFLRQTLERHPKSSASTYGLGYAWYLQERFEEARGILRDAIRLDPENALAHNNLGAALAELKRYEDALKSVKQAVDLAPGEWMFYRNLKIIYVSAGHADKFEEEYRQYLKTGSRDKARGYGLILAQELRQESFRLYADGKMDETLGAISTMLKVYREIDHPPGVVAGLFSLAILYEEQGEIGLAAENYREVLKINPKHIQAREKLGLLKRHEE